MVQGKCAIDSGATQGRAHDQVPRRRGPRAAHQDADEFKPWLDADAARLADVIKKIGKAE